MKIIVFIALTFLPPAVLAGESMIVFDMVVTRDGMQLSEPRVATVAEIDQEVLVLQGLDDENAARIELKVKAISEDAVTLFVEHAYRPQDQPLSLDEVSVVVEWGKPFEISFQHVASSLEMRYTITATQSDREAFKKSMHPG